MKRFFSVLVLAACGGTTEPPKTETDVTPVATATQSRPRVQVQNEFGTIDDKQAAKVVGQLTPTIQKCHTSNLKRVEFLGGDLKFYVRIGEDGHAKWVYFEDSSLGDREAEKCMLDVLSGAQWPKPEGGPQAELRSSFGFDAPGDVRQPTFWNSDKIAATIGKHQKDLDKCTDGVKAKFTITAYVEPAGKDGKVIAAGVSTSSQEGADKIDCLVDVLKKMKMPSPGSWAAKVSFQL
jgi:hypothetical protein